MSLGLKENGFKLKWLVEKEPCAAATLKQVHSNSAVFEECMKVFRIFICQPPVHENWCRQNSGVSDDEKEQKKLDEENNGKRRFFVYSPFAPSRWG